MDEILSELRRDGYIEALSNMEGTMLIEKYSHSCAGKEVK
jgi:hypothetical protein